MEELIHTALTANEFGPKPAFNASEGAAWVFGIVLQTATFKIYGRIQGSMGSHANALITAAHGALGVPK